MESTKFEKLSVSNLTASLIAEALPTDMKYLPHLITAILTSIILSAIENLLAYLFKSVTIIV